MAPLLYAPALLTYKVNCSAIVRSDNLVANRDE